MTENKGFIHSCAIEHVERYGEIYAEAFSGEPWHDAWTVVDATVHVRDLLENRQAYGLEYVVEGQIAGFILGTCLGLLSIIADKLVILSKFIIFLKNRIVIRK